MLISHKASDESLVSIFSQIPQNLTEKAENLLNFVGLYQKRKLKKKTKSWRFIIWSAEIIRISNGINE